MEEVKNELLIPEEAASKFKEEQLALIRAWWKRLENRKRRSRHGEPTSVVCGVCKRGDVTLFNYGPKKEGEKRCSEHRS